MSSNIRIADYFFVASVRIDKNDLEAENPNPVIIDRFPETDYEDIPFTENAEFFCLPEGARIEYREVEKRKPYIFTFCFTQSDGAQNYGTSLVFYEKLKINGVDCYNKYNQELYIPKALCILSLKPFFSCHTSFLRGLYNKAVASEEIDEVTLDAINSAQSHPMSRLRSSSLHMLTRHSSQQEDLDDLTPIEQDIKYYVNFTPFYKPGYAIQIPLFHRQLVLECPPKGTLPFCDPLCMRSLLGCLSLAHIQEVVSTLLRDGQVLLHSRNKYQLTLCSTALLALLAPIQYTLTYIPLLPAQLIDYIEAPTPYLIGIYSPTLAKHAFDADSLALLVHLDFDKLSYPPSAVIRPLPIPRNALLTSSKPLRYSVLWADRPDSKVATSCLFSLHLGPGPLGAYLQPERRQLVYVPVGTPAVIEDVVVLNSAKSRELKGWIGSYLDKCPLLQADPVILEINDIPVVGMSFRRVSVMLASAPRPLTLLLQIGLRDIPKGVQSPVNGPLLDVRVPNQVLEFKEFFEEVRISFFSFFVSFFQNLGQFLPEAGNAQSFATQSFIDSFPESERPFAEEFCHTQLFEGLLQTLERELAGKEPRSEEERETCELMGLARECAALAKEKGGIESEEGMRAVRERLVPKNWKLKSVVLPGMNESLPESVLDRVVLRSTAEFPRLDKECLDGEVHRYEI